MEIEADLIPVIPARAGSKRLPGKNRKEIAGKDLVGHAIDHIKDSEYLDIRLSIIATDDKILANRHEGFGGTLFRDGQTFGEDYEVINTLRSLTHIDENHQGEAYIYVFQPTSPLRTPENIDHFIECWEDMDRPDVGFMSHPSRRNTQPCGCLYVFNMHKIDDIHWPIRPLRDDFWSQQHEHTCVDIDTEDDLEEARELYEELTDNASS